MLYVFYSLCNLENIVILVHYNYFFSMKKIVLFFISFFIYSHVLAQCELSFLDTTNILCNGDASAAFDLDVSNAILPYNITCNGIVQTNNPSFSNLIAGEYLIIIEDAIGCEDSIEIKIKEPQKLSLSLECDNQNSNNVQIEAYVSGGVENYLYNWKNENNEIISESSFVNYLSGNFYSITVQDNNGCIISDTINIYAQFEASTYLGEPPLDITFTNLSSEGEYLWSFSNGVEYSSINPFYIFEDIGPQIISLTVIDESLCSASYVDTINVQGFENQIDNWSGMYNVFSPNGDEVNNIFTFADNHSIINFNAIIYNRWGKKIYEWNDPKLGWNGKSIQGDEASEGVYFYSMKSIGKDGTEYELKGSISLYR